jgi:hypothetical protein
MRLILNVGLGPSSIITGLGDHLAPSPDKRLKGALSAVMREFSNAYIELRRDLPEDTLVVDVQFAGSLEEAELACTHVAKMAWQDCAAYMLGGVGYISGPRGDAWKPFDLSKFTAPLPAGVR